MRLRLPRQKLAFETQLVSQPSNGNQKFWFAGLELELQSEPSDMHVDRAFIDVRIGAPHAVEQGLAVEDDAWAARKKDEKGELLGGKVDFLIADQDLVADLVDA